MVKGIAQILVAIYENPDFHFVRFWLEAAFSIELDERGGRKSQQE